MNSIQHTQTTTTSSFFTHQNLLNSKFTTAHEMTNCLKLQAKKEGFTLSLASSMKNSPITYYCQCGTKHPGIRTKNKSCPFKIVMTQKDGFWTLSTHSGLNNFMHSHDLYISQANNLNEGEKAVIKKLKMQEGSNNTVIKSLVWNEKKIVLTTKDIAKISKTQQTTVTDELQVVELEKLKQQTDGEGFLFFKPNRENIQAILSIFGDTTRKAQEVRLILSDETEYKNVYHNWSICPLTILDKNLSNELLGYVIAGSFGSDLFQWVFQTLKDYHTPELKTIVSDNASALKSITKTLNLAHQKCLWHAEKHLKKADYETKLLIYRIGHAQHPEIIHDLTNILRIDHKKWADNIFQNEVENYTICLGAQPNYGIVVSSRAESMNASLKKDKKSKSFYTLANIETHFKFVAASARQNAAEKKANTLLPNHALIKRFSSLFEPEIVLLLFQQIQNAANLQLVKAQGTTRVYHDIKEEEILKKSYQITKQYHYDVTKNEKEFICTCMYPKTMELPCSHIIKYCADTGTSLHLDFCKHWGIKPLNDVLFEITNTTIEEIAKLRKNIDSIKKNKKIAGEIQQLVIQKSNANIQHLRSTIDKIKKQWYIE